MDALYFPHTTPRDKTLLKEALLLWDRLEFIVPWEKFRHDIDDPEILAVLSAIGRPHIPSEDAKRRTHTRLERLLDGGLPAKYLFRPDQEAAPIYADKLASETWEMLQEGAMVGGSFRVRRGSGWSDDYNVSRPLALAVMTVLAEECAGRTALKVTDADYASDAQGAYLTRDLGGDFNRLDPEHETCIVRLPVPVIPLADISLKRLTEIRVSESAFLRELRRNYRAEVEKYIADVSAPNSSADDFRRIAAGFASRMRDDLGELDRMLDRRAEITDYTVAEIIVPGFVSAAVTYAASSSSLAAALTAAGTVGATGVFKLMGSIPLNKEKREEVLRKNPASWLYHVQAHAGRSA